MGGRFSFKIPAIPHTLASARANLCDVILFILSMGWAPINVQARVLVHSTVYNRSAKCEHLCEYLTEDLRAQGQQKEVHQTS